jgi:predicted DsbA family dithiol-disulfide isomerase
MFAQVAGIAAAEGLELAFHRMSVAPNTRKAHRLVLMSDDQEQQERVARALFKAYFTDGANVSDPEVLVEIGTKAGLDAHAVREYLSGEENVKKVDESQQSAEGLGVTGVPFYIFNERYAFSGAQPVEVFLRAIDAATEAPTATDGATS